MLRSGGAGTVTSLFVRGGESDYNKILLDGVPLNEPGGTFYLSNLTTENLERVEVVRGAFSSLFGSDAMASVVQLFTKRATTPTRPQVSVQVDGGTYSTLHSSANVYGATSRIDYSAAVAQFNTDNRVPNNALSNTTLSGTVGIKLTDTATLRAVARAEREHVGTPGQTAFGRPDLDAFFERHDDVFSLTLDQQIASRVRQQAGYSLARSDQQSTNLIADPPYIPQFGDRVGAYTVSDFLSDSLNAYRRHHASYQADVRLAQSETLGDHTLTLLADWDGERATATNRLTNVTGQNARDNFGAAVQDQMLWPRLFVTVGGRVEKNASFGTAFTPRGSAVFIAHRPSGALGETSVSFSAGTGIKEPTLAESFSLSPFFLGNPALDPERSKSIETGVTQRLAHDRARVSATYFDNHFTDVIQLVTTDPATFSAQYFNTGATRARGVELGVDATPVPALRLRGNYTFLDGKVTSTRLPNDPVFGAGQSLFRRPANSGTIGATLFWRQLTMDLDGVFVGQFADSDFGTFTVPLTMNPGHTAWNARVNWHATRQLTGLVVVDNLTNRDYSEPFGYQPLLRTVRAGIRVSF
jgi:outer membrane cobalamin receptor